MKTIWIEGTETAGLINDLANGFREQGFRVFTFAQPNHFYNYAYDLNTHTFISDLIKHDLLSYPKLTTLWFSILIKYFPHSKISFLKWIQKKILLKHVDYFLPIYNLHFSDYSIFKILKQKKIKIVGYFLGSEVRIYEVFCKHFNIDKNMISAEYFDESFVKKAELLAYFEKYAHCIFSVPDQMSLATRPYFHLQLPFNTSKLISHVPLRKRPLIVHCPSNSGIKGTSIILATIEELRQNELEFDFELVQNKPHAELLHILTNADILIDELLLHGPGLLSFEAMGSGCVVLTKYFDNSPASFKPPVIAVTERNLKKELTEIIFDLDKRKKYASLGKEYLLKHNTMSKVIKDMSDKLARDHFSQSDYEYFPEGYTTRKNCLSSEQIKVLSEISV